MNVTQFQTESGSTYQIQYLSDSKRVRRVFGITKDSKRLATDGAWKEFEGITTPQVGAPVIIIWGFYEDPKEGTIARSTQTTFVTDVHHLEVEA